MTFSFQARPIPFTGFPLLLAALLLGACAAASAATPAGNDCPHGTVLSVVAHTDDDLLFMNPDVEDSILDGQCVRTAYLTGGDRDKGLPYLLQRERGIMAAYAAMADVPDLWDSSALRVGTRTLQRHTLRHAPRVQLIMLRLPDAWLGSGWGSLTPLSELESIPGTKVRSYGPHHETYTRSGLVELLANLIGAEHPQAIRLMDPTIRVAYQALCWRCKGHDHPDHIASARLMDDAMTVMPGLYRRTAYLDYPSQERPANLSPGQAARKTAVFLRYMKEDPHYCPDPARCGTVKGPEAKWVWRQYTVSDHAPTTTAIR